MPNADTYSHQQLDAWVRHKAELNYQLDCFIAKPEEATKAPLLLAISGYLEAFQQGRIKVPHYDPAYLLKPLNGDR